MLATLENTVGYLQKDLDRFNEMASSVIDSDDEQAYKALCDKYLTIESEEWDF